MSPGSVKIREWRMNPAQFVFEVFGATPDRWQEQVLNEAGKEGRKRIAMKACAGPGKSAILAWLGWHRLACFAAPGEHPKGAAVSITRENLEANLWAEMAKWRNRSPFLSEAFEWTASRIYAKNHPETWFLSARGFPKTADQEALGQTLSGLHSQFPFFLIDESGGMSPQIGKSAEQGLSTCVDGLIATAGNPTSTEGLLYAVARAAGWWVVSITGDPDDPNRSPRIDIEWARAQIAEHGRDNPWVMAFILGLFPPGGINNLLSLEDVEKAMGRHLREEQYSFAARILGVDVARQGDDRSCLFKRQGLFAQRPTVLRKLDTTLVAASVAQVYEDWNPDAVMVDGTGGYGAGVIDALRMMGRSPMEIQFAGSPTDPRYANKRAEMWFEMAKWVKGGGALPDIQELKGELTAPTYSFQKDKFLLEPKEAIKARLGRSPDLGDALALTFAYPVAPGLSHLHPSFGQQQRVVSDYDPFQDASSRSSASPLDYDPFAGRD